MTKTTTFTRFLAILKEELTDGERYTAESWDHHSRVSDDTREKMYKALDRGDHTIFPLQNFGADADADVAEHLSNHGWDIHDYKEGTAKKVVKVGNPERGIPLRDKTVTKKIGAILEETKAEPHVKAAFANDPARQGSKTVHDGLHVVISTHPMSIAGMSTGRDWASSSCMDMRRDTGYNQKLQDDSETGTHVAYLVHANDKGAMNHGIPDNPIARIALKAFHENSDRDHEEDTVFRPEPRSYGEHNSDFTRAVDTWARENYPAKADTTYHKNRYVYHDAGDDHINTMSKESALEQMKRNVGFGKVSLDHDVLDHLVNHIADSFKEAMNPDSKHSSERYEQHWDVTNMLHTISGVQNLKTSHLAKLHKIIKTHMDGDNQTLFGVESSPDVNGGYLKSQAKRNLHILADSNGNRFSRNQLDHYVSLVKQLEPDANSLNLPQRMLMNSKLTDEHIDQLDPNDYRHVHNSKIKDHHLDKVIDNLAAEKSGSSYVFRDNFHRFKSQHLDRVVSNPALVERMPMAPILDNHPHWTRNHHDKALETMSNSGKTDMMPFRLSSRHAHPDDLRHFHNQKAYKTAVKKLLSNEHLDEDASKEMATDYWNHGNISQDTVVPPNIAKHITPEQMVEHASKRASYDIRFQSLDDHERHLNVLRKHIDKKDNELSDYLHDKMSEDDDYDRWEDPEFEKKSDELRNLVDTHHHSLDNFVDDHVYSDERGFNHNAHEIASEHAGLPERMNNYDSEYYVDSDNHGEIDEKLNRLYNHYGEEY